jgi:hypothetical protein
LSQLAGFGYVSLLPGFVAPRQHDNYLAAPLDVVHPPAGAEVFTGLHDAIAYWLDVAPLPELKPIQPA